VSAPVDVLAVSASTPSFIVDADDNTVAQTFEVIDGRSNDRERTEKAWQLAREIVEAMNQRAAVAELVEAAKLQVEYSRWCFTAKPNGCHPTQREKNQRRSAIDGMFRAALARIGGAA
jgi:hypothetical protein